MTYRIEHRVTIAAPIDVVWRLAQSMALRPRWDARVRCARFLNQDAPTERGRRFEVIMDLGGLPLRSAMEFLSWKPPYRCAVRSVGRDVLRSSTTGSWQFTTDPITGHTTWLTTIVFGAALPVLGPWVEQRFGRFFDRLTQLSQQQFKTFVEEEWRAEQVAALVLG
jgi:uncharacterized protein YndB with AHSA1/START domain